MKAFERLESIIGLDSIMGVETPEEPFVCRSCDATHEVAFYVCPVCGGFSVERRETGLEE